MRSSYKVREVGTTAGLEELRPAWQELWNRCPTATPFDSPAWLLPWWRHLGHSQLWTLAVKTDEGLAGLAPWLIYTDPNHGLRRVLFLGTSVTDQMNILCLPGQEKTVTAALAEYLREHAACWDVADFQELSDSPLRQFAPEHFESREDECAIRPVISLPATGEAFRAQLGSGLRRNLRRYREQLRELGPVSFETAARETHEEFVAAFFALHRKRWKEQIESMLDQPRVQRFHCAAMRALAEAGLLRLHGLRLNGELVAVVYAIVTRGRGYSYLGGFRPELSGYSPGTLIMGYAIEQAIGEGTREWDFLRGAEKYKYMWGAVDQPNYRVRWRHPGSPPHAFHD